MASIAMASVLLSVPPIASKRHHHRKIIACKFITCRLLFYPLILSPVTFQIHFSFLFHHCDNPLLLRALQNRYAPASISNGSTASPRGTLPSSSSSSSGSLGLLIFDSILRILPRCLEPIPYAALFTVPSLLSVDCSPVLNWLE